MKPLRKPVALEVPDFIPLRLDAPMNESQAAISQSLRPRQQSEVAGVPDDFDPEVDDPSDAFVGQAGMAAGQSQLTDASGNPVTPEAMRARAQQTIQNKPLNLQKQSQQALVEAHPVLQRLRERFGLKAKGVKSETIGGMKFTFRKYTNQAYAKFVVNQVQQPTSVQTDAEFISKLPYALAAISIAAIDDIPTHIVFGSEIELDPVLELPATQQDPLHPPTSVTVKTAEVLYSWLVGLGIPELADTLASTLGRLFPEERLVKDNGLWRYSCPKRNCTEEQERMPRYDADGNMKPVYCPVHGVPMRALGSLEDLANIPLA